MAHTKGVRSAERSADTVQLQARTRGFIESLHAAYDNAIEAVAAQREAVRRADTNALARATAMGESAAASLQHLDFVRRDLWVAAVSTYPQLAGSSCSLSRLALCFDPPIAASLSAMCAKAQRAGERLARESAEVRTAVVSIGAHVQGMMQQIGKKLSHAGTYGRRGRVEHTQTVMSALDLKS
jgi:hypothetical protein